MSNIFNYSIAKRIPITDYLASLGIGPAKVRGNEYWYHSPFREDRTPSFKVDKKRNLWYDHGVGKGGTILDLGMEIHRCTIKAFLDRLIEGNFIPMPIQELPFQKPGLEILSFDKIEYPELIKYVDSRGIDLELARQFCHEVEFRIGTRTYRAIGFANRSGGYELRNNWFKGSSSPKDISLISNGRDKVCVLEGFIDFLSSLQIKDQPFRRITHNSDFLVLNSLSFVKRALPILQTYRRVNLFLDNDLAANQVKSTLKEGGILYRDVSHYYSNHKDVNDYLRSCASVKRDEPLHPRPRSRLRR